MELKFISIIYKHISTQVLIAPLWNWNSKGERESEVEADRSNRTFMELKWDNFFAEDRQQLF